MLTFNEARHEYRLDGMVVPSVTQILKPLTDYSRINPDALERARQQGVAIHKTVELDVAAQLDEDALPEWLRPYLSAWRSFGASTEFRAIGAELRIGHPTARYAGTPDLICVAGKEVWLIDVKRSLYAGRAIGLQTAGYARLWHAYPANRKINRRFALVLRDATYRLEEFKDPHDDAVFLAALTMHKWTTQGSSHHHQGAVNGNANANGNA